MSTVRQARSPSRPRAPFNPNRRVTRRDTTDPALRAKLDEHRGEGKYTPTPGRGPYGWKAPPPLDALDWSGGDWVTAPGSSHLASFRFIYGIDTPRPVGRHGLTVQDDNSGQAFIQVRFKEGGWAVYWSEPGSGTFSAVRLETIFHYMEAAEKPGEIIWSHLITERWPYDTSA
jgi:hypothetical protein